MGPIAVELDRQAQRDLRKLHPDDHRAALRALRDILTHEPLPANANDRALKGHEPWRRLRVGELRIIWRPVDTDGTRRVARVVHRGALERAVRTLSE